MAVLKTYKKKRSIRYHAIPIGGHHSHKNNGYVILVPGPPPPPPKKKKLKRFLSSFLL
jgi:hypothetical protein